MNRVAQILARPIIDFADDTAGAVAQYADVATARQIAEARAHRMTVAFARVAKLLADRANVSEDGQILFPLPWGRAGAGQWNFTRDEAAVMRGYLAGGWHNKRTGRKAASPIVYDEASRRWWVLGDRGIAIEWLSARRLTSDDVIAHWPARK